jgi:hypothetical protein
VTAAQLPPLSAGGFEPRRAAQARRATGGVVRLARQFILTGTREATVPPLEVDFPDFPMMYLILAIADAFFLLREHCCICGAALPGARLRPSPCEQELCRFAFSQIGVGHSGSVAARIRRDPRAADFVVFLASAHAALKETFPDLPEDLAQVRDAFFSGLPAMRALAECETDAQLGARIGQQRLAFLQYVLSRPALELVAAGASAYHLGTTETVQFLAICDDEEGGAPGAWMFCGAPIALWWQAIETGAPPRLPGNYQGPVVYPELQHAIMMTAHQYTSFDPARTPISPDVLYKQSEFASFTKVAALVEVSGIGTAPQAMVLPAGTKTIIRAIFIIVEDFACNSLKLSQKPVPSLDLLLKRAGVLK